MNTYVGIDNSSLDHKVRIIDENGKLKKAFTVENSLKGFNKLDDNLRNLKNIRIGFELPHGPLIDFLQSKNYHMYSLNPLKIKRFKESLKVSGNKDDSIDALAITEYLKNNSSHSRELLFNSPEVERLKTLGIIHTRLTHNHARYLNKLYFVVRQYFPLQERLFSNFGGSIHLKLLKKYTLWKDLKSSSPEEITAFLMKLGYRRKIYIEKLLGKIKNYEQVISPDIEYAYQFEAEYLCDALLLINDKLKQLEKEMNRITDNHNLGKYFKSLPGAGPVLSCKMLSIFGDNKNRFNNANGIQCLFGTAPKNYQSGNYHKITMRKACNKSARAILYKFAFSSIRLSNWARQYYDKQRAKGKNHSVAIRALSNKWVKVIYAIWKNEIFYEEKKKNSPCCLT